MSTEDFKEMLNKLEAGWLSVLKASEDAAKAHEMRKFITLIRKGREQKILTPELEDLILDAAGLERIPSGGNDAIRT